MVNIILFFNFKAYAFNVTCKFMTIKVYRLKNNINLTMLTSFN